VAYTDDVDAAVKIFKQYWAGTTIVATHLRNIYTPEMVAANRAVAGDDVIRNRQCISSNPKVHDAGFNRLYFHSAGPDQYEFIEGYGGICFRSSGKGTFRGLQPLYKSGHWVV
jgi:coenzyme F420-dependent glucose-6-phosphate dehydrogenase